MKVKIVLIFVLLQASNLLAQDKSYASLQKQIRSDLHHLMNKTFVWDRNPNFDAQVYCNKIAKKLLRLLTYDESREVINTSYFLWEDIPPLNFGGETNDKRNIRIYDIGYDCGGTRGWITHPVIQYTNDAGKLFAYDMSPKVNCHFFKIYLLQDDIYLLLGEEKGSGACRTQTAYVIQFNGDYLTLDYPAFIDQPNLSFCNITFDYNQKTKVLTTKAMLVKYIDGEQHYDSSVYNLQNEYPDKDKQNKWYSYLAIDIRNGDCKLIFKNGAFRKMRKNSFVEFYGIEED